LLTTISSLRIGLLPLDLYRTQFDRRNRKEKMIKSSERMFREQKITGHKQNFELQVKALQNAPREENKLGWLLKAK
jgi:hypothetical protein